MTEINILYIISHTGNRHTGLLIEMPGLVICFSRIVASNIFCVLNKKDTEPYFLGSNIQLLLLDFCEKIASASKLRATC